MLPCKFSAALFGLALSLAAPWLPAAAAPVKSVVIVHGAFADGSGWREVSDILTGKGYAVSIVQQPLTSLADDVAATRRILSLQTGPAVLVGHSYCGMLISEAGNDSHVAALVYVAAFEPDKGESLVILAESKPVYGAEHSAVKATADGLPLSRPPAFAGAFAADLPPADAAFLAHSQVFAAKGAFTTPAGEPAWKSKPSGALVATADRSINPELELEMARRAGSQVRSVEASPAPPYTPPSPRPSPP